MQGTDHWLCYNTCKGLFYATHSYYSVSYKNAVTQRHLLLGPRPKGEKRQKKKSIIRYSLMRL